MERYTSLRVALTVSGKPRTAREESKSNSDNM